MNTTVTACVPSTVRLLRLVFAAVLCGAASAQNDECAGAVPLALGSTPFDTSAATTSVPGFACASGGADLWFVFTPAASGTYSIGTCGSSFDTLLELFSGSCGSLVSVACNDDACGVASRVAAPLLGGVDYLVRVGGFNGDSGTGSIDVQAAPLGDDCVDAELTQWVGAGTFTYDNGAATAGSQGQNEAACNSGATTGVDADVWAVWTADRTGVVTMKTCGSDSDTKIAAYPGANCPIAGSAVACSDDRCGLQSAITFPVAFGDCFLLQLGQSPGTVGGSTDLVISFATGAQAAVQNLDGCAAAALDVQVGGGVFAIDTTGATTGAQGQSEASCYAFGTSAIENDVWFLWRATSSGAVTVSSCGSGGSLADSRIAVYPINPATGPCPADGTSVACNDDGCGGGAFSELTFEAGIGEPYLIQVGSFPGSAAGTLDLTITESGLSAPSVGTNYCSTNPNSTGQTAAIRAVGSAAVQDNTLYLIAEHLPCAEFGFFVAGSDQGFIANPGGSVGNFCLGGPSQLIGRINQQLRSSGGFGRFSVRLDLDRIPVGAGMPPIRAMLPGDTWYFQAWYRDSHNGVIDNNFSDGIWVLFL